MLGDQLNPRHSWFDEVRHDVVYVLMEMRQETDEWRLDAQLTQWAAIAGLPVHAVDSEHFFTTRHEAAEFFAGRKR